MWPFHYTNVLLDCATVTMVILTQYYVSWCSTTSKVRVSVWWYRIFPLFLFILFIFCSVLFCSVPLHSTSNTQFPYFPDHCHALHSSALLCLEIWLHSIHEMLPTYDAYCCCWNMSRQLVSQDTALHVVSGPLVYKSILDEGYVLTWCLNPIDAFCVCPASRLNPIISVHWKLRRLTHFYLPDFKPYWTHFPALVSWPPATSTAGSASQSQSSRALL